MKWNSLQAFLPFLSAQTHDSREEDKLFTTTCFEMFASAEFPTVFWHQRVVQCVLRPKPDLHQSLCAVWVILFTTQQMLYTSPPWTTHAQFAWGVHTATTARLAMVQLQSSIVTASTTCSPLKKEEKMVASRYHAISGLEWKRSHRNHQNKRENLNKNVKFWHAINFPLHIWNILCI